MARVFQGKIVIPGDQIEAYLEALGQFEQGKAPLRTQLEQYARDLVLSQISIFGVKSENWISEIQ